MVVTVEMVQQVEDRDFRLLARLLMDGRDQLKRIADSLEVLNNRKLRAKPDLEALTYKINELTSELGLSVEDRERIEEEAAEEIKGFYPEIPDLSYPPIETASRISSWRASVDSRAITERIGKQGRED